MTAGDGAYLELVAIRQHVFRNLALVQLGRCPLLLLLAGVLGDVRDGLLDQPHHLLFGARVEDVAALAEQGLQIFGYVSPGHVDSPYAIGHRETLIHRYRMRHAVARVQYHTCCPAARVQGQDGLD
jgi:hypothetical protein